MSAADTAATPVPTDAAPATSAAQLPNSEAVNKILNVPFVSDSLKYAQDTIKGYPHVANAVTAGQNLAASGINAAAPYTARINPHLQSLDGLAVKGLNYAEQTFPAAFTTTPAEVATGALAQAYASRVVNPAQTTLDALSHNEYVQKALTTITSLQGTLTSAVAKTADSAKDASGSATREAESASKSMLAELDGVRTYVLSLPAETLARLEPIKLTFTDAFGALAKELRAQNETPSSKFHNILKYVKDEALPALHKAIQPTPSAPEAPVAEKAAEPTADEAVAPEVTAPATESKEN